MLNFESNKRLQNSFKVIKSNISLRNAIVKERKGNMVAKCKVPPRWNPEIEISRLGKN